MVGNYCMDDVLISYLFFNLPIVTCRAARQLLGSG